MFQIAWQIVEWLINKFTDYKLKSADTSLEKDKLKVQAEESKDKWKAVILVSTGAWWFQLFFIIPLALWFAFVVLYSMFWCQDCMAPQTWSVAALPPPLNEWAGAIIAFLFLTQIGKK